MPHFVDELREEAEAAMAAMRAAALDARDAHARAELMRHMLTTAMKVKDRPKPDAVEAVLVEWMNAWHVARAEWPHIAREMEAFTGAFYDYANDPGDGPDAVLRLSEAALATALAAENTSIADQMAFRSQCAHGWWDMVKPTPRDLPGRKDRPTVPRLVEGQPFWTAGCAEMCG